MLTIEAVVTFLYYKDMSVLNPETVGQIIMSLGEYYEVRYYTFPNNAIQQVANMFKAKRYPIENIPGIFEIYRMIQDELAQFEFYSQIDCQQTLGIPPTGYMGPRYIPGPYLKITDKFGTDLGYISISENYSIWNKSR